MTDDPGPITAAAQADQQRRAQSPRARRQTATLKEGRAVQLRLLGFTYEQIAAKMLPCPPHRPDGLVGCGLCVPLYPSGKSAAKKAIDRALQRDYALNEAGRDQLRQQQLGQVDLLLQRAMREAMGDKPGRHEAMRNAIRLLDRRARLLGLDAPTRVQVTSELDAQIEEAFAALRDTAAPTPEQLREA